jgi:hypothetical protein
VDKTALVDSEVNEGHKFLELLREAGMQVNAAMWRKEEAPGRWSLLLVMPSVDEIGDGETFRLILDVLSKAGDRTWFDPFDVSLISPKTKFAKDLRRKLRTSKNRAIVGWWIADQRIDDGYLYFAK